MILNLLLRDELRRHCGEPALEVSDSVVVGGKRDHLRLSATVSGPGRVRHVAQLELESEDTSSDGCIEWTVWDWSPHWQHPPMDNKLALVDHLVVYLANGGQLDLC